jgi:AAA+ ATPase superfamily predicted ATPase
MSQELIDRTTERARLQELAVSGSRKLVLMTGPRRVGKTYLLNNVWEPDEYFLFTASRTTPELNRKQLIADFARWSGEDFRPQDYPTWRTAFDLLLTHEERTPLIVILDEFQYLADGSRGLAEVGSELNAAWERPRTRRDVLLVLTGSEISAMEELATGGGPLYGRVDWHARIKPFDYWYAQEMAPYVNLRDKARLYGVFGGTPRYLAAVDAKRPLWHEVARLHLAPHGEVRQLLETSLDQEEGLREVSSYRAIVRAVAGGATTHNEIAQRTGLANDTALREKLRRLQSLGYLEEVSNYVRTTRGARRYAVADPAHRFHQRFVEPNTSMLEMFEPEQVWKDVVEPNLDTYMGHAFERIAGQAYVRLAASRSLPLVKEWSRWEGTVRDGGSVEVDIVAPLADGDLLLTGSVKWGAGRRSLKDYYDHLRALERVAESGQSWAHAALDPRSPMLFVAAGGFAPGFEEAAGDDGREVHLWTLEDLYGVS